MAERMDPKDESANGTRQADREASPENRGGSSPSQAAQGAVDTLNVLCVRNLVLFPGIILPISVGRRRSVEAVQDAVRTQRPIALLLQKDPQTENPGPSELYQVGTTAEILRYLTAVDGSHHAICQGQQRFRVLEFVQTEPFLVARAELHEEPKVYSKEIEASFLTLKQQAAEALQLLPQVPQELEGIFQSIDSPGTLADMVTTYMDLSPAEKQEILETFDLRARLEKVTRLLAHRLEVLKLSREISQRTKGSLDKAQREYYLREQLKTIQKELGEEDAKAVEIQELSQAISASGMPPDVEKEARRELQRLERMPEAAAEYSMIRTYLDWLIELPWSKLSEDTIDIARARAILEEDHYGLEKVKRRILEFLAVRKLKPGGKSAILCLVGPPGVGKTSIGQSVARAMNRKFVRISLGGVHDEAEIRGHRRTYVGAMPGNIIQGIRKAGTRNPVFMLDELDKLSASYHGDPASALLEVLDPEQNSTFRDNYLGVPFDLSQVMFIGTANILDLIPGPLRDRCEVIEMTGYTEDEKLEIAKRYLVRRRLEESGLAPAHCAIGDDAIREIIRHYTREAGCRNLEREIGAVCRHVATRIAEALEGTGADAPGGGDGSSKDESGGESGKGGEAAATVSASRPPVRWERLPASFSLPVRVTAADLRAILGPRRFESETALRTSVPGVATGLAWTPSGGDILFVEVTRMPGKGNLILTGQLGDVMKESAQAAVSLIKSRANAIGVDPLIFEKTDLHIHVPAGAIPKDGPSAGVTIYTALYSLLTERTVRHDVAMTGEISLRGLVLPVGGIKEKVLAAHSAGVRTVLLPARNRKDFEEIPPTAREKMSFVWLETVDDAVEVAVERAPTSASAPPAL